MSARRRGTDRGQDAAPLPTDQKVWSPADTPLPYGAAEPSGLPGGRRRASSGRDGYAPGMNEPETGLDGYGRGVNGPAPARNGYDAGGNGYAPVRDGRRPPTPGWEGGEPSGFDPAGDYAGSRGRRGSGRPADEPSGAYPHIPGDVDLYADGPPTRASRRRRGGAEPGHDGTGAPYADDYTGPTAPRAIPDGDGDGPPTEGSKRRRSGGGGRRGLGVLGWISVGLTAVLVIGTLTAYKVYRNAYDLIVRGASTDDLDKSRPVNATGAINVLLVGSDTRAGDNKKYGQHLVNDGERTDTIMLLHVSPNRDGATLLSFPRDSMVMIPQCRNLQSKAVVPPHLGMINSAFSDGGMICTRRTIETLTQIHIDHYVKVDFTGFKNIVNALNGIQICLPQAVNDRQSKLNLPAGKQVVKGEQALAYVRLRHGIGDGSDIGRIRRQQVFISQVVKKATSSALLTDVGRLNAFIDAAARSVTMDDALNAEALLQIAQSAKKLTAKGFKATTVPWIPDPANPKARVVWKQPDAGNLFNAVRSDTEVTATPSPSASASGAAAKPTGPVITKPQQVKIQVFNGTNTQGKGKEVAEQLAGLGFKVVGVGDARKPDGTDQPKTLVRYTGPGWDYSKILTGKLLTTVAPETGKVAGGPVTPFTPASPPPDAPVGKVPGPVIQLVVGADWKGVRVPLEVGDNAVTADTDICAS
ncbi:LCP family protein [Microbispora sp. NPDC049125]|uniref:LCP family protein n=1 Tax=Microbispora sp. NPDC049125 TaxID=3154929 RepID=UPI003465EE2F